MENFSLDFFLCLFVDDASALIFEEVQENLTRRKRQHHDNAHQKLVVYAFNESFIWNFRNCAYFNCMILVSDIELLNVSPCMDCHMNIICQVVWSIVLWKSSSVGLTIFILVCVCHIKIGFKSFFSIAISQLLHFSLVEICDMSFFLPLTKRGLSRHKKQSELQDRNSTGCGTVKYLN